MLDKYVEYRLKGTFATNDPLTDCIVMLHPNDMNELKVGDNDYVNLKSDVKAKCGTEIYAQVINAKTYTQSTLNQTYTAILPGELVVTPVVYAALGLDAVFKTKVFISKAKKFIVEKTTVTEHPSTDYLVILRPDDMKELLISSGDYIRLTSTKAVPYGAVEIMAQVVSSDEEFSKGTGLERQGQVGIDQTLREALGLKLGDVICLPKQEFEFLQRLLSHLILKLTSCRDWFLSRWGYQKVILIVEENPAYLERKTPVACLCEDTMSSIDVIYGDKIKVEYKRTTEVFKCAKLENMVPENTRSPVSGAEIHTRRPIFMDEIGRLSLDVKPGYPVKARRSLTWQFWKGANRFGSPTSLIAASVILTFAIQTGPIITTTTETTTNVTNHHTTTLIHTTKAIQNVNIIKPIPVYLIYWGLFVAIVGWGIWSALTHSMYRASSSSG